MRRPAGDRIRKAVWPTLLQRWAQAEPVGALAWMKANGKLASLAQHIRKDAPLPEPHVMNALYMAMRSLPPKARLKAALDLPWPLNERYGFSASALKEYEPEELFALLEKPARWMENADWEGVIRTLAEREPEKLKAVYRLVPERNRGLAAEGIVRALATGDPEGTWQWLLGLEEGPHGPVRSSLIGSWLLPVLNGPAPDYAALLDRVAEFDDPNAQHGFGTWLGLRSAIYRSWMHRDPVAARASLDGSTLSDGQKAAVVLMHETEHGGRLLLTSSPAPTDHWETRPTTDEIAGIPRNAPGPLDPVPVSNRLLETYRRIETSAQAQTPDFPLEVTKLDDIGAPIARERARRRLWDRWARVDPVGAYAHSGQLPGLQNRGADCVIPIWAATDPEAAFAAEPGSRAALKAWCASDPERAIRHALAIKITPYSGHQERESILMEAFAALGASDPHAAVERLALLDSKSYEKRIALHEQVRAWVARDVEGARAWAVSTEDDAAYGAYMAALIAVDPAAAARQSAVRFPRWNEFGARADSLAAALAEQDPDAAMAWIQSSVSRFGRNNALNAFLHAVARKDFARTVRMFESFRSGERLAVLAEARRSIARELGLPTDERSKIPFYANAPWPTSWRRADPAAYRAWRDALPPEEARLLTDFSPEVAFPQPPPPPTPQ